MRKKLLILGSTGSIGKATLEVIADQIDTFEVLGLACKDDAQTLNRQIERFRPHYVCIVNEEKKGYVNFAPSRLLSGSKGIREMLHLDADIVVNALPGSVGLEPTIDALKFGKVLALANKESLVMAGRIISKLVKESPSRLIPVDSEHSALYQLLQGINRRDLKSLVITASGGPFREYEKGDLERVGIEEALKHPTWKMGNKVTLDSATLMNKGFEVIEARWLFDIAPSRVKVLVHPESILHGIIELIDNSLISYMAYPDMRIPISFAINEGTRRALPFGTLNLEEISRLTFYPPDMEKFPSLRLAFDALDSGDSALVALNAANEAASTAFADGRIRFTDIPVLIEEALGNHPRCAIIEDTETTWRIHAWAKKYTEDKLGRLYD